jgi:hypothetical protein
MKLTNDQRKYLALVALACGLMFTCLSLTMLATEGWLQTVAGLLGLMLLSLAAILHGLSINPYQE